MSTAIATSMHAILLSAYGKPAKMALENRSVGTPAVGEVLVKVMASPINPSDLIFLRGQNPNARPLPSVPGFEGSGTVIKSGGGDEADALVGKNVAFRSMPNKDGAWAEYTVTTADRCILLLPSVSYIAGSMLLVNPLTAWSLVDSAVNAGHECAIQNAAASALGKMVIKYAKERKLKLINIVRKAEQVSLLECFGAERVLNSETDDFESKLRQQARDQKATVAFDAIAGSAANQLLKVMRAGSELWSYGGLSEQPLSIDPMVLIYEQKTVRGFWGPPTFYRLPKDQFDAANREIQERLDSTFKSAVHKTFSLGEFSTAIDEYETNMTKGKVLFLVDASALTNEVR